MVNLYHLEFLSCQNKNKSHLQRFFISYSYVTSPFNLFQFLPLFIFDIYHPFAIYRHRLWKFKTLLYLAYRC